VTSSSSCDIQRLSVCSDQNTSCTTYDLRQANDIRQDEAHNNVQVILLSLEAFVSICLFVRLTSFSCLCGQFYLAETECVTRGATTAEKLRWIKVWVPTSGRWVLGAGGGRPLPLWGSGGITPGKFLKTLMLNPAFWWLLAVKFLAFWKLRPRSGGTNTLLVPNLKVGGPVSPGSYGCCAYVCYILLYGIVQGGQKYTVRQRAVSAPCDIMCLDIIIKCRKLYAKHFRPILYLLTYLLTFCEWAKNERFHTGEIICLLTKLSVFCTKSAIELLRTVKGLRCEENLQEISAKATISESSVKTLISNIDKRVMTQHEWAQTCAKTLLTDWIMVLDSAMCLPQDSHRYWNVVLHVDNRFFYLSLFFCKTLPV